MKDDPFRIKEGRNRYPDISLDAISRRITKIIFCPYCKIKMAMSTGGEYHCPNCGYMPKRL